MIKASFVMCSGKPCGFSISGHSGYADHGSDIVCAAATSAVRYAECVINDVMGLRVPCTVNGKTATIAMELRKDIPLERYETCQALLEGMIKYFRELKQEFPDNIDVLEV